MKRKGDERATPGTGSWARHWKRWMINQKHDGGPTDTTAVAEHLAALGTNDADILEATAEYVTDLYRAHTPLFVSHYHDGEFGNQSFEDVDESVFEYLGRNAPINTFLFLDEAAGLYIENGILYYDLIKWMLSDEDALQPGEIIQACYQGHNTLWTSFWQKWAASVDDLSIAQIKNRLTALFINEFADVVTDAERDLFLTSARTIVRDALFQ